MLTLLAGSVSARQFVMLTAKAEIFSANVTRVMRAFDKKTATYLAVAIIFLIALRVVAYAQISAAVSAM